MPSARLTDPQTSHDAAKSVRNISPLKQAILDTLQTAMTDEELILSLRFDGVMASESGIRSRRADLVREGYVEDSNGRSKTAAGRSTIIWVKA